MNATFLLLSIFSPANDFEREEKALKFKTKMKAENAFSTFSLLGLLRKFCVFLTAANGTRNKSYRYYLEFDLSWSAAIELFCKVN